MTHISSVEQVITALGGAGKTAAILGQKSNTVGNWKLRDKIPAEHFLAVTEALKAEGKTVAPEVFGMRRAETVEGAPSAA